MKQILIIDQHQFGYLTDTYSYCRHLTGRYDVTYLCWDYGFPTMSIEGIRVLTVSRTGGRIRRVARFLLAASREIRTKNYDVAFIVLFSGCSLLRLVRTGIPLVVDLRTGSEKSNRFARWLKNRQMALEASTYEHISIISSGLRDVLRLRRDRCHILPLGADPQPLPPKQFDGLRLLYVGTLIQRHIEKTVEGLDRFLRETGDTRILSYDIVGDGFPDERKRLEESIRQSGCSSIITYHGRIPFARLTPFFERCNAGVAFVPMTPYFHPQPSTKVFEYFLSGMPVIATATDENLKVVTSPMGVVHEDTAEGFCDALARFMGGLETYSSSTILKTAQAYAWENIVRNNLEPFLERIALSANTPDNGGSA